MKTININFNVKSINNAIKQINDIKLKLQNDVIVEFLKQSCQWIIDRANQNLNLANIGNDVIADIQLNWQKPQIVFKQGYYSALVQNISDKSVYVEFGVGIVGQEQSHPNALIENYEYNIKTDKKDKYNQWRFKLDNSNFNAVDLDYNYYDFTIHTNGNTTIRTKGSPAQLYLFNALVDYADNGYYNDVWQKAIKKIIK